VTRLEELRHLVSVFDGDPPLGRAGRVYRHWRHLVMATDCWTALGRVPTASEFLRWRLTNAPDSPGQAAVYRFFPGGWQAVLEALPPKGAAETGSPVAAEPLQPPPQPLHVPAAACEDLARVPDVQPGSVDQVGHEGVAGHEVAAWQRE
jgi:hypothetical protein